MVNTLVKKCRAISQNVVQYRNLSQFALLSQNIAFPKFLDIIYSDIAFSISILYKEGRYIAKYRIQMSQSDILR